MGQDIVQVLERAGLAPVAIEVLQRDLVRAGHQARREELAQSLVRKYRQLALASWRPTGNDPVWTELALDRVASAAGCADQPDWRLVRLVARQYRLERGWQEWWRRGLDSAESASLTAEFEALLRAAERLREELQAGMAGLAEVGASAGDRQLLGRCEALCAALMVRLAELRGEQDSETDRLLAAGRLAGLLGLDPAVELLSAQLAGWSMEAAWQLEVLEDLAVFSGTKRTTPHAAVLDAISRCAGSDAAASAALRLLARNGQWDGLIHRLEELDAMPPGRPDSLAIWNTAVWCVSGIPHELETQRSRAAWIVMVNLARMDSEGLVEAADRLELQRLRASDNEFHTLWVTGLAAIRRGQRSQRGSSGRDDRLPEWLQAADGPAPASATAGADLIERGLEQLDSALARGVAAHRPGDVAQCALQAAGTHFRQGHWRKSLDAADRARRIAAAQWPALCEQASQLALNSGMQAVDQGVLEPEELRAIAGDIASGNARGPAASMARFLLMRLQSESLDREDAVEFWGRAARENPEHIGTALELMQALARTLRESPPETRAARLRGILDLSRGLLTRNDLPGAVRCRAAALAAQGLADASARPADVPQWLAAAAGELAVEDGLTAEDRNRVWFAIVQLSEAAGNPARREEAIHWLVRNAGPGPWHRAALIRRAEDLRWLADDPAGGNDSSLPGLSADEAARRREEAIAVYSALLELEGGRAAIGRSANARLAAARLGVLLVKTGRKAGARELFEAILAGFPSDRGALESAGQLAMDAGDADAAAGHFRKLAQQYAAGSGEWRQARYNLLRALQPVWSARGEAVLQQTLELDPDMPTEWRDRFESLRPR